MLFENPANLCQSAPNQDAPSEPPPSYYVAHRMLDTLQQEFAANQDYPWATSFNLLTFIMRLFDGKVKGYNACDTGFHNLDHTLYTTSALIDLLVAYYKKEKTPKLEARDCQIGIAAALFHDVGYLKHEGDNVGTGAKYSAIHVGRSCYIAAELLPYFDFEQNDLRQVRNAILATALDADINHLAFQSEQEFIVASLLVTADLISQMAVEDYPERLEKLYLELQEAEMYSPVNKANIGTFHSLLELMQNTDHFFSDYVLKLLNNDLRGYYHLLDDRKGVNPYLEAIRKNITKTNSMADLLATKK